MISVSQALQSLTSASSSSTVQLSRTALIASALPPTPSVAVSLGKVPDEQVLYTALGLLVSAPPVASAPAAANNPTTVAPTSETRSAPAITATAQPASIGLESVQPAVVGSAGTAVNNVTPMPVNVFLDLAANAQADFTSNPIHGGLASSLNVNAAIYRAKQLSSASLVNAIEVPGPVSLLNAINVDIADLNQNPSGDQRRRTARS